MNQVRTQIDQVIESEQLSHYNFGEANFRYIEKTVNFASKLEQIDSIIRKELIDGTMDSITPQYVHQVDPLLRKGVKKLKLTKVNDYALRDQIKHLDITYDHQGHVLTMNGSKYKNFNEMKEMRAQRDQLLEQPDEVPPSPKTSKDDLTSVAPTTVEAKVQFKYSPKRHRKQKMAIKLEPEPIIKVGQILLEQVSNYFKKRIQKAFDQDKYLRIFQNFRETLSAQMNDDKIFEDILKEAESLNLEGVNFEQKMSHLPDELYEQRFFDSGYDKAFKEQIGKVQEVEVKQRVVAHLTEGK